MYCTLFYIPIWSLLTLHGDVFRKSMRKNQFYCYGWMGTINWMDKLRKRWGYAVFRRLDDESQVRHHTFVNFGNAGVGHWKMRFNNFQCNLLTSHGHTNKKVASSPFTSSLVIFLKSAKFTKISQRFSFINLNNS